MLRAKEISGIGLLVVWAASGLTPDDGVAGTLTDALFWALAGSLIVLLVVPRLMGTSTAETLGSVLKYVLAPTWLLAYIYRVAGDNGAEPGSTISFVGFWVATAIAIACFLWRRNLMRRRLSDNEPTLA